MTVASAGGARAASALAAASSGLPLCLSSRQAGRRPRGSLLYSLYRMLPWLRRINAMGMTLRSETGITMFSPHTWLEI